MLLQSLHGGLLSPYDGATFRNYHHIQIESDESGPCLRGSEAGTEFATVQLLYRSGLV